MRKLTSFYMLCLLLPVFIISSCDRDEVAEEGGGNIIEAEGYLKLSELHDNPVSLTAEQGTYILKVLSDKAWTANVIFDGSQNAGKAINEWCILSATKGIDASEIYIGFSKNRWNIARAATVQFKLKDSQESYSFALNQKAAETMYEFRSEDLIDNQLTFKKIGQTCVVDIITNAYDWKVKLVDHEGNDVDWCALSESSGSGDGKLSIVAAKNETDEEKTAYLEFYSLDTAFEHKLSLKQKAESGPFENIDFYVVDNNDDFCVEWVDRTENASYTLTLSKDATYSDVIGVKQGTDIIAGGNDTYSVDLSTIDYGSYIGTIYVKLDCLAGEESAIKESSFNSHFDASSGNGSSESVPYIIRNARHLKNISKIIETGKFFKQQENVVLTDINFIPLCDGAAFSSLFDGGNFSISGLTINAASKDYAGLFSEIGAKGIVKNVKLKDVSISAKSYIGSIAGKCMGAVTNCVIESGSIIGATHVGGLIGAGNPSVEYCINRASVQSSISTFIDAFIGGIIGYFDSATTTGKIVKCGNHGNISAPSGRVIGGIIGRSINNPNISECYNKGTVSGDRTVGGIIGMGNAITIKDCYNTGAVLSSTDLKAAGIEGSANNANTSLINCYNVGVIDNSAGSSKGYGMTYGAGNAANGSTITSCYSLEGVASAIGVNVKPGGAIKTESAMKQQSTYQDWDFSSVWTMSSTDGYPKLKWE